MHRLTLPVSSQALVPDGAQVTWTGGPPPDEDALVVWQALNDDRVTTYAALVERAGERLFRRDLDALGAAADIGFLRSFYAAYARQVIAGLAGTLLRIGAPA